MPSKFNDLDLFIAESDRRGGPGAPACESYWLGLEYEPKFKVDESLDPFSEEYVEQQLLLYVEVAGRSFDQQVNEHTPIDIETHVHAVNPYNHGSPAGLSLHLERLSRALRFANPPRGGELLDLGCGWGLSSELAAYCGLTVTGVDINPDFVSLVNRRVERTRLPITATQGAFDTFVTEKRFDLILFYECFHHALRPWTLLERIARLLKPEGKLVMAGEPINDYWWKHWGLRLDPLSIYCIRKFGWLESGWSQSFLAEAFKRSGLDVTIVGHPEGEIGFTIIGAPRLENQMSAARILGEWSTKGWFAADHYLISQGVSELEILFPDGLDIANLRLQNFRGRPLWLTISGAISERRELLPGETIVEILRPSAGDTAKLRFVGETWRPSHEIGTLDDRMMAFHLQDVRFL